MTIRPINRKLTCPKCGHHAMILLQSNHNVFYGCERFPECKGRRRAHPNGIVFTDEQEVLQDDVELERANVEIFLEKGCRHA